MRWKQLCGVASTSKAARILLNPFSGARADAAIVFNASRFAASASFPIFLISCSLMHGFGRVRPLLAESTGRSLQLVVFGVALCRNSWRAKTSHRYIGLMPLSVAGMTSRSGERRFPQR